MNESAELPVEQKPFYTLTEISALLAFRVQPDGESLRKTRDKVRKRLRYAVENDYLHVMGVGDLQLFFAAEVFAWARRTWPDAFGDIRVRHEADLSDAVGLCDSPKARVLPGELNECHELLLNTYAEADSLKDELARAERELARLRPLAERYEEIRARNRSSAKKSRNNV